MHVVFHSPGENGRTIELFRDTAEIRVERVARGFVAQERTTVFGGEDEMNVNGGKGLWHVERVWCGASFANPKGIVTISPGLRGTSYPGKTSGQNHNPNRVAANVPHVVGNGIGRNRVAVGDVSWLMTQGSRVAATLGFGSGSPWDSPNAQFKNRSSQSSGTRHQPQRPTGLRLKAQGWRARAYLG